ncbi:MAG: amphi-Trp domain-containing protein [Pseudomonadota bacterium]
MKKLKTDFRHESIQDNKSIQEILMALCECFGKKELTFSDEDDTIVMNPEGLLHLKISAFQDENDNRVNIRIKWQTKIDKKKQRTLISIS